MVECLSTVCKARGLILKSANSGSSEITLMFAPAGSMRAVMIHRAHFEGHLKHRNVTAHLLSRTRSGSPNFN